MEFICAYCGRKHIRTAETVNEFIRCECGYSFLAFQDRWLNLTMPLAEVRDLRIGGALNNMLIYSGRIKGQITQTPPADYEKILQTISLEYLVKSGLERLQKETYGTNYLKTCHLMALLGELNQGHDTLVKLKKDQGRIVLNRIEDNDLTVNWEEKPKGKVSRAGDHYRAGKAAKWQKPS